MQHFREHFSGSFPVQIVSGPSCGITRTSQSLIGDILPFRAFGSIRLQIAYNLNTGNTVIADLPGNFQHSSGVESIGYVFNSAKAIWRQSVSGLAKLPNKDAPDGDQAVLIEADGGEVTFTKSKGIYWEDAFGTGCRNLVFDTTTSCWILYANNLHQQRHVYDGSGHLVAKYVDGEDETTFEWAAGRLTKIIPPGEGRSYEWRYQKNADNSEIHTVVVVTDKSEVVLRAYKFNSDGMITTITSDDSAATAPDPNGGTFQAKMTYTKGTR